MIITLSKELKTSTEDIEWFKARYDDKQVELSTLVKDLKADDKLAFVWRLLPRLMKDKVTVVKFAVYCAELVLPLFEQQHAYNKNPRLAIEAAKSWIANPCEETRKATRCATGYATAGYAANTAAAARYAGTYAFSRNAATWTARDAAYAAKKVSPELHAEVVDKIVKYGFKLIEEK